MAYATGVESGAVVRTRASQRWTMEQVQGAELQ